MDRGTFVKEHLSGREPRCDAGELVVSAAYELMFSGPHKELIKRHYEYTYDLILDAYDLGIRTILASLELVEKCSKEEKEEKE